MLCSKSVDERELAGIPGLEPQTLVKILYHVKVA